MSRLISDWKWASVAASCMLVLAAIVAFVLTPGGFEGQNAWFLVLLPGSIPTGLLSDLVYKFAPSLERVVYWVLLMAFDFGWYWGICFAVIKVFRAGGWQLGSPEF